MEPSSIWRLWLASSHFPHFAEYAATKAFVLSFTEALAEELNGTGVRVLALCPGSVRTEIDVFAHNAGLLGKLPSLTAEQVVNAGLRALDNGRVVKVVGRLDQFLPFIGRFTPRQTMRWLMGMSVKPFRSKGTMWLPEQFGALRNARSSKRKIDPPRQAY